MRNTRSSEPPNDESIRRVLVMRSQMEAYPLTEQDVLRHEALLIDLIRKKIMTLAGLNDHTPLTIVEALNHVLMSSAWLNRETGEGELPTQPLVP